MPRGVTTGYYFESRPDTHTRKSAYLGNKLALGSSVLDLSYRFGTDDWGIDSHTVEAKYRLRVGGSAYIEPQLRWYKQSAADFYSLFLTATPTGFMSADPRLAAFTAKTVGVKLGMPLANGDEVSVRLEGYQQDPKVAQQRAGGSFGSRPESAPSGRGAAAGLALRLLTSCSRRRIPCRSSLAAMV